MEPATEIAVLLPLGLGLLGFIEPCTLGAHLIFVQSLASNAPATRLAACASFVIVRIITMGAVGGLAAFLGKHLIVAQTTLWLVFGVVYSLLGLAYLLAGVRRVQVPIRLAPLSASATRNPVVLGVVFGLNIPACAAPILFALIGFSTSIGSAAVGFLSMALFGFALSMPLFLFVVLPAFGGFVERMGRKATRVRITLGIVFLILGLWSVWFGMFVDPADWTLS